MNIALPFSYRVNRIAVSIFFFIAGLTFSTWASRIPDVKNSLGLSDAGLGVVLFALPVGQMISLPLSAWLISRFSSRNVVITAALLYPTTLILLGYSTATWQLVIGLFLFGLWANLMNIAMNTQAVGVEKLYGRSIMASFHGLWSLAGFTGAVTGTFFISNGISPLVHFIIIATASALMVFVAFKYALPTDEQDGSSGRLFTRPDKQILILGLIAFCCMLCEGAMADWSGVYFEKVVNAPVSLVTVGYVAFTCTMATGRFVGDWLVTRFNVKRMLQTSGIMIAGGLMIAILLPGFVTATVGFLLVGFGVSSVVPIVYGLAAKNGTMSTSAALAAVSSISFLGFLIGPPVIGFISQLSGMQVAFSVIALMGFGTTLLASSIKQ
ncbi:MFS transporter [Segetibacter sp. 3557_3]|uniref:MFS transporter n=1 Tax=Segetibacter sp. 3557_3 TaxID=2547429 RepID=UPI0010585DEA|nr:MFS transporter [Segetibacter sp. 3557_3]TDH26613.1 MFS transporter [Segetibacter sp. 3557_3]